MSFCIQEHTCLFLNIVFSFNDWAFTTLETSIYLLFIFVQHFDQFSLIKELMFFGDIKPAGLSKKHQYDHKVCLFKHIREFMVVLSKKPGGMNTSLFLSMILSFLYKTKSTSLEQINVKLKAYFHRNCNLCYS